MSVWAQTTYACATLRKTNCVTYDNDNDNVLQAKVSHGARRTSTHERLLRPDAELQDHRRLSRESQRSAWPPQRPLLHTPSAGLPINGGPNPTAPPQTWSHSNEKHRLGICLVAENTQSLFETNRGSSEGIPDM